MEIEALIITISHKKPTSENGRYVSPQEFYKQEIPMQWLSHNNPEIIRKIIAVVNNLTNTEEFNHGGK